MPPAVEMSSIARFSSIGSAIGTSVQVSETFQLEAALIIAKEVSEVLSHLPYIQPLCSLIMQFVKLRNAIKDNQENCQRVIDKVLVKFQMIHQHLMQIGQSPNHLGLKRLEAFLMNTQRTLAEVYRILEPYPNKSKGLIGKLIALHNNDVDKCDRMVDDAFVNLHTDMLFVIGEAVGQWSPPPNSASSIKTTPSVSSSDIIKHVLPPPPTRMIEREGVLKTLIDTLVGGSSSRIAILGGQGVGKTACSLFTLHDERIRDHFGHRFYMSCESITNAQSLLAGIAHMLGISASKAWLNLLPSISQRLHGTKTLMCLDNFESAWDHPDTRAKVEEALSGLSSIDGLSLVITVAGKKRPGSVVWSDLPPLDKISLSGAEIMVRDITGVQTVDQCTRLLLQAVEGIPLAITLLSNLLREGEESSNSLWTRWSYKERRQNSIMRASEQEIVANETSKIDAAIAISIHSPQMKKRPDASRLLAVLSLLPDGFSLERSHLMDLQNCLNIQDTERCIRILQTLGLVRLDEAVFPHRIRALLPVEHHCQKFLADEISSVSRELTRYYINIMLRIGMPRVSENHEPNEHTDEMAMEIRNMHFLFRRNYTLSSTSDTSALEDLIKASHFLSLWSIETGYMLDDILELAIKSSEMLPIPRAQCRLVQAAIYSELGRLEDAEELSRLALGDFQRFDNLKGQEDALSGLAAIFKAQGRVDLANATLLQRDELHALYRERKSQERVVESGNAALEKFKLSPQKGVQPHHIASIHLKLGVPSIYMSPERLKSALGSLHHALEIYTVTGHHMGQATALFHIGYAYLLQNELGHARRMAEQGRAMGPLIMSQIAKSLLPSYEWMLFSDQVSESEVQAVFLTLLSHIAIREDRLGDAQEMLKRAMKRKLRWSVNPSMKLGWLYIQRSELDKAEKVLDEVQQLCRKWDYEQEQSEIYAYKGIIQLRRGNLDAAEHILTLARVRGLVLYVEVDVINALAEIQIQRGNLKDAEDLLKHALYIQKHIYSSAGQGTVFRTMGDLYFCQRKFEEAQSAYEEARKLHRTAHWVSEEIKDIIQVARLYGHQGNKILKEELYMEARRLAISVKS